MKYRVTTNYAEVSLLITVETQTPTKIKLRVYDEKLPKRMFTDRWKTVNGVESFKVRMPISPDKVIVEVSDKAIQKKGQPESVRIRNVVKEPLQKRFASGDIAKPEIKSFVEFAQRFVFNIYELEPNQYYKSNDGEYYIHLLPTITGKSGKELNTPARVSRRSGIIQVSKKAFENMTIPMQFAILCHEFSHFYLNEVMDDEIEADLNGLLIYLGLGYPRIEAYQAFLETFKGVPSQQNKQRYDKINKFIHDFDRLKMVIK